jgi:hypothetical protein
MAKAFVRIWPHLGKTKSSINIRIFFNELLDFLTIYRLCAFGGQGIAGDGDAGGWVLTDMIPWLAT